MLELEVCLPLLACLGIVLEVLLEGLLCVRDHSLELVARKELAVLTDALMRKDDMALVVDGHDQEERQQDGRNEYTTQGRADEVKTALDEAVPLAGQVVLECQHEDLFAEERLCLDASHRCADEVRHEGDVPDMRLDLLDEVLQCLFLEARRCDDDILDAGVAHDGLCVFHLAVEQEFLRYARKSDGRR